MKLQNVTLPSYSKGEEIFNCVSHGLGVPLGIVFFVLCAFKAVTPSSVAGSAVFCASVIILYTCSMLYHSFKVGDAKRVMRLLDHSVIFILITGTAAAINLICVYPHSKAFSIITVVLSILLSTVGIILTLIDQEKYKKMQMALYMVVGWTSICLGYPIIKYNESPWIMIALIASGGIIYTVGTVFYSVGKKKKYFHSIFHLFVLAGTVLHFAAIYIALK